MPQMTVAQARKKGIAALTKSPTAQLDVDVILAHIINCEKAWLISHRDDALSAEIERKFFDALALRGTGLPVAYITGRKEFYGLDFCVTRDVLIPKPDTELLVERALEFINNNFASGATFRLLDVCAGSGCVGISIAHELATRDIPFLLTLADISEAALEVAKKNAARLLGSARLLRGAMQTRVSFACGDLLNAIPRDAPFDVFDVIVSNPPYVPSDEVTELLKDGRSEPRLALDGGSDGLSVMRRLVPEAYARLLRGGALFVESGEDNAEETAALMKGAGFSDVTTYRDLANLPRVTAGKKR